MSMVLRTIGFAALALLTLEATSRIDDYLAYGAPLFRPYSIDGIFRGSPYGREGIPNARYRKWQMNHLGYRGPDPRGAPNRVLVFGASEMFGLYESEGSEVPRVIERHLNGANGAAYDVTNGAIPGIKLGRVGYLEDTIRKSAAQVVIVYPSPANYIGMRTPLCGTEPRPVVVDPTIWEKIRIVGKGADLLRGALPIWSKDIFNRASIWLATRDSLTVERVPPETIDAFREDLRCALRAIRRLGAAPVLVTHATYFRETGTELNERLLTAWRRFYPNLHQGGFLDLERKANATIRELAASEGVTLVDLARDMPGGRENFADFVHFTDAGALKAGRMIAAGVSKEVGKGVAREGRPGSRSVYGQARPRASPGS